MTDSVRKTFTLDFLEWTPWLERATDTDLTPEQRERVEAVVGSTPNSDYINVLANDFPALQARAVVHRHVYTSSDPEPSSYRELGAATTSRINGCVYCASVHARMFANFAKKRDLAQRFLDDGIEADLPPLERAIVDLSAKVTTDPESLAAADLAPLRDLGFDDLAILDVINYAAFFANANRLMLTLGEPKPQASSAAP
ncbi:MAG: hypothetical protein QOF33_4034 [Thermomicrobiales bacterium]|jgi:uncharacterized peroxidase-related enzyme|nr:hypothetical protein [Thermomicrobiales bacterium]